MAGRAVAVSTLGGSTAARAALGTSDATLANADRILDQIARAAPSGLSPRSLRLVRSQHSDLRAVIAGMGLLLLCFGAHLFSPSRR